MQELKWARITLINLIMSLNHYQLAQITINKPKRPQMSRSGPKSAQTFVKSIPVINFSVRYMLQISKQK